MIPIVNKRYLMVYQHRTKNKNLEYLYIIRVIRVDEIRHQYTFVIEDMPSGLSTHLWFVGKRLTKQLRYFRRCILEVVGKTTSLVEVEDNYPEYFI